MTGKETPKLRENNVVHGVPQSVQADIDPNVPLPARSFANGGASRNLHLPCRQIQLTL
jgi:hypothetical protein